MSMVGKTIAHYSITEEIGRGGMGEVYLATDTKLKRQVAIKILSEALAGDGQHMARLTREAEVLASLDHPGIGQIYGIEDAESGKALVLQLIEGPTLADRIKQGPMSVEEALPIALEIAEALEAAHEKGIIHRDLKPANIKITPEGKVKILDFGLAKAVVEEKSAEELANSPTLTMQATQAGVILGTAGYMSPEQARGRAVDKRTDIWAFGAVLYEMLSGRQAFPGDGWSEILARVIEREPNWEALPNHLPRGLEIFLRRCLTKEPNRRLQAIGDMRLAIEGAFETGVERTMPWRRVVLPWLIAASAIIVAGGAIVSERWSGTDATTLPRLRSFTIEGAEGTGFPEGLGPVIDVSPDGETVVFAAEKDGVRELYRRSLGAFEAIPIRGTEGALMPFFSPDGEWIAFGDETLTEIKRVSLAGGDPFVVCRQCSDGHWGDDGSIVFSWDGSLFWVPEIGGEPELLVEPMLEHGIVAMGRPNLLPGGMAVLFDINPFECGGIGVFSLATQELIVVTDHGTDPFYSPTGHILFARGERTLFAVPFDLARLDVTGRETPVLSGVRIENGGTIQAKLSRNGVLVYAPAADEIGTQLVLVERSSGQIERVLEQGRFFRSPRFSPDGRQIALQINAGGSCDLWVREAGTLRPLTNTGGASNPIWAPDGRSITFSSRIGGSFAMQSIASDGTGGVHTLLSSSVPTVPEAWSSDGRQLIFREDSATPDLFITDMREPGSRREYVVSDFSEHSAAVSPSGEWVAYVSDQTGSNEVYVRPFPGPGRERRVSRRGGKYPSWGRDESELVFRSNDDRLVFLASLQLDLSEPVLEYKTLFDPGPYWNSPGRAHYDVHPNGRQFLMLNQGNPTRLGSSLRVVENWFLDLKRLVGAE